MPRKAKSADTDTHSEAVEAAIERARPGSGDASTPGVDLPAGGINDKIRNLIRLSK